MEKDKLNEVFTYINEIKDTSKKLSDSDFSIGSLIQMMGAFLKDYNTKLLNSWGNLTYKEQITAWEDVINYIDGDELALTIFFLSNREEIKDQKFYETVLKLNDIVLRCMVWESLSYDSQKKYFEFDYDNENDAYYFSRIWEYTNPKLQEEKIKEIIDSNIREDLLIEIWKTTNNEVKQRNIEFWDLVLDKLSNSSFYYKAFFLKMPKELRDLKKLVQKLDSYDICAIWGKLDLEEQEKNLNVILELIKSNFNEFNEYRIGGLVAKTNPQLQRNFWDLLVSNLQGQSNLLFSAFAKLSEEIKDEKIEFFLNNFQADISANMWEGLSEKQQSKYFHEIFEKTANKDYLRKAIWQKTNENLQRMTIKDLSLTLDLWGVTASNVQEEMWDMLYKLHEDNKKMQGKIWAKSNPKVQKKHIEVFKDILENYQDYDFNEIWNYIDNETKVDIIEEVLKKFENNMEYLLAIWSGTYAYTEEKKKKLLDPIWQKLKPMFINNPENLIKIWQNCFINQADYWDEVIRFANNDIDFLHKIWISTFGYEQIKHRDLFENLIEAERRKHKSN